MYIDGLQAIASGSRVRSVLGNSAATLPGSGTDGDYFELTAIDGSNQPGIYLRVSGSWVYQYPVEIDSYDIVCNILSVMEDSAIVLRLPVSRKFTIKENFVDCLASSAVAATAETVLTIKQGATTLGTITFAAAGTSGTIAQSTSGDMVFEVGDILTIEGPATADTTLTNVGITLAGYM